MQPRKISVNLDDIANVAHKGVRRASVFMGLGVNAANDPTFQKYQLSKIDHPEGQFVHFEFVPNEVDEDTLKTFKAEFRTWIVSNGLRELIEAYAVFLDRIYDTLLLAEGVQKKTDGNVLNKRNAAFLKFGIEKKLKRLWAEYGVRPEHPDYI